MTLAAAEYFQRGNSIQAMAALKVESHTAQTARAV
jgi:hypothetical protein